VRRSRDPWTPQIGSPSTSGEGRFRVSKGAGYDQGTYNIGVRPTEEDLGQGKNDPFGNPLSFIKLLTLPPSAIPSQELLAYPIPNIANPPIEIGERALTDGTFKVPSLRNLELTAPYFHNGGQRTIRQVVEFYNRGGDFREHNVQNIDFEIGKLNLTERQIDDLVAFLGRPLTDMRVVRQSAPFDHPQIFVPNGVKRQGGRPQVTAEGVARDVLLEIPAVGRKGGPLPAGFLEWRETRGDAGEGDGAIGDWLRRRCRRSGVRLAPATSCGGGRRPCCPRGSPAGARCTRCWP
jgi:hypothetical protein